MDFIQKGNWVYQSRNMSEMQTILVAISIFIASGIFILLQSNIMRKVI